MVDDDVEFEDETPALFVEWSDAEFFRAVALTTYELEIEELDGAARAPDYDW